MSCDKCLTGCDDPLATVDFCFSKSGWKAAGAANLGGSYILGRAAWLEAVSEAKCPEAPLLWALVSWGEGHNYIVMAYIVMAYIVMAY